jgi:hypothetical protein
MAFAFAVAIHVVLSPLDLEAVALGRPQAVIVLGAAADVRPASCRCQ